MKTRPTLRLLTAGLCAATLTACGDDGSNVSSATGGQTQGSVSTDSTTNTTPGGSTSSASDSGSATDQPTTGMSGGETEGTTGATDTTASTEALTSTSGTTDDTGVSDTMSEPVCGNSVVEAGEACDDGNTMDGDECSADCQIATPPSDCGDGTVQAPEVCDDGNEVAGDGCEPDCTLTPPMCGNGKLEPGEQCDDGNQVDGGPGDFCKNDCTQFFPANCSAPADYIVCDDNLNPANKNDKTQAHKAMGICNDQPNNSVQIANFTFNAPDNTSWTIAKGFGTYTYDHDSDPMTPNQRLYSPREGSSFLMISSGNITAPDAQGIVNQGGNTQEAVGDNGNPDGNALPAPFSYLRGSNNGNGGTPFMNCDGVDDCSDTLQAQWQLGNSDPNDALYFTFTTTVPAGTYGYTFDFVYCSAEWPQWVNDPYNDMLIVWQTDPTPDDPNANPPIDAYTGNVAFIPNPNNMMQGLPLTVTALDPYLGGAGFSGNEPQLAGTGFVGNACSDWFTAKGGVQPGANVTIGFYIADMGDTIWTTTALIDNFRWDCEGCVPSEVDDCGIQPM